MIAIGVVDAIKAQGLKVPDDISVIGFDDIDAAIKTESPLTTVKVLWQSLADMRMKKLLGAI